MTTINLNVKSILSMTEETFRQLCQENPEYNLELTATQQLVIMSPTGGITGNRNIKILARLEIWVEQQGLGMGQYPETPKRVAELLKKQKGKCTWCGLHFRDGDVMEVDHKKPKSKGGSNKKENLQLLHGHCHDEKTREDSRESA